MSNFNILQPRTIPKRGTDNFNPKMGLTTKQNVLDAENGVPLV